MKPDQAALRARFDAIDRQVQGLVEATGLACPTGCGACCLSPEVEAAPEELELLAEEWVRRGEAPALLGRLTELEAQGSRTCALYQPTSPDGRQGRCGAYAWRPLICRLFGFAARTNRQGARELVVCKTMANASPEVTSSASAAVASGTPAPEFSEHAHGLIADLGGRGAARLPINRALQAALQREALRSQLQGAQDSTPP